MALSIEDIFENFMLDSGDSEKINVKQIVDDQDLLTGSTNESDCLVCDVSGEQEIIPNINGKALEEKSSSVDTTNILPYTSEKSEETKPSEGDKDFMTSTDAASVKYRKKQGDKANRRVHFNTQVETFIFDPKLGIKENYNYTEEFSVEQVFADVLCEGRFRWKSEGNLALNPRLCPYCPIMEEWIRCDHHFHQLRKGHFHMPQYSKLNDEDFLDDANKKKPKGLLKRSRSCLFGKKNNESENESYNLKRRFSMSMQNLKLETKSLVDKFLTVVMKKQTENPTSECAINTNEVPTKESGDSSKLKRKNSFFSRKRRWEDKSDSPNATSGMKGLRAWKSMQNLNREKDFDVVDISEVDKEDITDDSEKDIKLNTRLKIKRNLFQTKEPEVESASTSSMSGNYGLRSWKSMQNLKNDSKSFMDKIFRRK